MKNDLLNTAFFSIKKIIYFPIILYFIVSTVHSSPLEDFRIGEVYVEISGKVTDEGGMGLPGATISIAGSTVGTISDMDGNYSLEASEGDVLVFTYIGFETQRITVGESNIINVTLVEEASALNEVVVVGYGTQKKVNLTGAVSTIDFDKEFENRPITNASQALAGQVTGVWVSQNSGAPGSDAATLRVRGFGTLNNTNPLVLIDGVEGRLNEINPNDIASMTVLKDAASSAIYGSRAANGVVLVTTKRGAYDAEPQLSYNGYVGMQQLGMRFNIIDNSSEFMGLWNQAVINSGGDPLFPQEVIAGFQNNDDPYRYPNTNFFDEVFQTAPITEHNLSVRGGSARANYYLSANYLNQEGIIKETSSSRYGINFNVNSQVNDWIELGGTVQVTRKITHRPYDDINRIMYIMSNGGYPFTAPYTRDGDFGATQAVYLTGDNAGQPIVDTRNPLPDMYNGQTEYVNNFFKTSINADLQLSEGLLFRSLYSGQFNNNRADRYNESIYTYTDGGVRTAVLDFPSVINNIRNNNEEFYWAWFNTLNYDRNIDDTHFISAVAGVQLEGQQLKTMSAQRSGPPKAGLHEVSTGTFNQIAEGNTTEWKMLSYFGRVTYNFNEKYLFEANVRADASSRFSEENRWGIFPAFSAGWRISEEEFMQGSNFQNLKIRASWGRLGNQNISGIAGDYPYLQSITQNYGTSYNLNDQVMPGAAINTLVDPSISWETTESMDIGLEAGIIDNRLGVELGFFNKNTRDILVQLPIPLVLGGVTAPVENVGSMNNKGIELNVTYLSPQSDEGINYTIGVNGTYVENEVTRFRGGESPDQLYLIREGYSYQSLYGYKALGVYQSDDEARSHMANNGYIPSAGDLKYEDLNNDGRLDYQDKQSIGNTIPKYTVGLNFGISFRNWALDVVTQGVLGVHAYTQSAWTTPLGISGGVITTRWREAWSPENPSNTLPQIKINDTWNRYESSFWVTNLSYLRVKNIQLTYNLPQSLMDNLGIAGGSIYTNFSNLPAFVSSDYEGFDPERSTFNSGGSLYPTPFVSSIGVNVQF